MATNLGQMLAVAQAFASPQQQRALAESESKKKEFQVQKEKTRQRKEFEALMEKLMKEASGEEGMFGGALGKVGKLLSFIPAIGTGWGAGLQALEGFGKADAQKEALKGIMKDPRFAKYKGTWLGDAASQFKKDVKGLEGQINPLATGLSTLGQSWMSGKIAQGIGKGAKSTFEKLAESDTPFKDLARPFKKTGLTKEGWGATEYTPRKDLERNIHKLFGDFDLMDILSKAGDDKTSQAMAALPYLVQLAEESGEEVEFDPRSYFR